MEKKLPTIEIMVMGGTEAYFLDRGDIGPVVDEVRLETPYGLANKISIIELGGKHVGFMSRHGEHGYSVSAPFVNSRANIYAAKELGCKRILSWNGAGAISPHIIPGDYVIIDDYIDMTKKRDYTYYVGKGFGFIRQNPAFCPECREALFEAAKEVEPRTFDGGVYVCTEGPRLETKAEIRMYGMWGGDGNHHEHSQQRDQVYGRRRRDSLRAETEPASEGGLDLSGIFRCGQWRRNV